MKLKYKEVNANTYLWIPPSHHICLTFNNLVHIIVDGTRRFPLLIVMQWDGSGMEMKGQWLVSFKRQGWWESWVWMSGMLPDTG